MHKRLIFSILLLNILCMTNVDFGMELIPLKDFSIGFYNQSTFKVTWHDHHTNNQATKNQTEDTLFKDSPRTSCYMTYHAKDNVLDALDPVEQTILSKFSLSGTHQAIINKILQLKKHNNLEHIIIHHFTLQQPMLFFQSNCNSQFKIEQLSQMPSSKNVSSKENKTIFPNKKPVQPITTNQKPTQPITADQWNVKIKKDHWIDPLDCSENNKIHIDTENGDTIYPYCTAILNLKNNLLTITNNDGVHIVFDISTFNPQAKQLIMEASDSSSIQLWHSPSKTAPKKIFTITVINVIDTTETSNSETPRLDATPWWQNKYMIITGLTLGGLLFFLYKYISLKPA